MFLLMHCRGGTWRHSDSISPHLTSHSRWSAHYHPSIDYDRIDTRIRRDIEVGGSDEVYANGDRTHDECDVRDWSAKLSLILHTSTMGDRRDVIDDIESRRVAGIDCRRTGSRKCDYASVCSGSTQLVHRERTRIDIDESDGTREYRRTTTRGRT